MIFTENPEMRLTHRPTERTQAIDQQACAKSVGFI
jgi:hypothetical protein